MSRSEIAIVNWNGAADTLRALESIAADPSAATVAITIVDNGSTDGSVEQIRRRFPHVRIIDFRTNRGFTGGVDAAASVSNSEFLILLNNDATVEQGWLAAFENAIESSPSDVIAVGGKIVDPTGTKIDFVEGVMTFDGHAFQRGFHMPVDTVREPVRGAELLFACGGNMIVRRQPFLELGGFDDEFFAYLEDVDFGWRSWLSGYRVIYEPAAVVRHKSSATSNRLGNFERGVLFERNAMQTMVKNVEEKEFAAALAPVLLTLLHREHRYTVDRNQGTEILTAPPLDDLSSNHPKGNRAAARIDDPLTAMQFRATEWFFRNSESIMKKRAEVQKRRRRTDSEIFERFPIHYIPTYHGDAELMSSALFRALKRHAPSTELRLEDIISR